MKKSRKLRFLFIIVISITSSYYNYSDQILYCPSKIQRTPDCSFCGLKEWSKKVTALKEWPLEFSTLPKRNEYQQKILTKQEFISTLIACAKSIKETLQENKKWMDGISLVSRVPSLFDVSRTVDKQNVTSNFMFKPYAQRMIVPAGSNVILFGDLHGSVHSFIRDLLKLHKMGFIDNNFKLTDKNNYIVFLGDYTDRGIYGVECLYTIARLKIANPHQVVMARGNHEDYNEAVEFKQKYTQKEQKDSAPSFLVELRYKFCLTLAQEITICRLYDLLPVVVYLGCGTSTHTDFMHCCHGGLELGYDPQKLLNAPRYCNYELIDLFKRKTYFSTKLSSSLQAALKSAFDLDRLCADVQDIKFPSPYYKHKKRAISSYVGFLWNDFYVDKHKTIGLRGKHGSGWVYGHCFTQALLQWGTAGRSTLHGVIRAHQHNNETGGPMLNLLCCNKGFVDVWNNRQVFTLVSASDSKLENTGEHCFTYDSFVKLVLQECFNKWKFYHYFQDNAFEHKLWKCRIVPMDKAAVPANEKKGYTLPKSCNCSRASSPLS